MKTTFKTWLIAKRITPKTVHKYEGIVQYFERWSESQGIEKPQRMRYEELLMYVDSCRENKNTPRTIRMKISVFKHYFLYHNHPNNPADEIQLKGITRTVPNVNLTALELDNLYQNYNPFNLSGHRNKVMLGMVIYQGVGSGELERIELVDLQLQKGTVYIKGTRKTNGRILELRAFQLLDLQNYILKIRPEMQKVNSKQGDQLFISMGTSSQLANAIGKALRDLRKVEPKLQGFQQIRTSVITSWVKEYGLRKAQYLAGHKYVSSTEPYQQSNQEDLLNQLDDRHPF